MRCRHVRSNAIPRPPITPEVGLEARHRFETDCDQQITTRSRRWLCKIISADKPRLSQISCDVSQPGDGAPVASEGPDINGRDLFIAARQKLQAWIFQVDVVEQKGIVSSAIKVEERYSA